MSNITTSASPVDPNKAIRIARFFAYPKQVLYLLASVIFLVSLCHFLSLGYHYLTRWRTCAPRRGSNELPSRQTIHWGRLPASVVDSLRAVAFRYTVHLGASYTLNLAELGLTVGYIGVLFTWTFVNTTNLQGMRVDPKYYANRAGVLAASQIPIMTALGMRNNLISWLTGVSFDKLNYLHRLSARIICILGWIHGGGRITVGLVADEAISNRWVQCGPLAVSTLTLMCILTVRPVRTRSYEVFLAIHFLFAFIFILGIFFHLTGRSLTYYGAWPAMIIWGIDRLLRLVQLVAYNPIASLFPSSSPSTAVVPTDATVTLLSPNFLRITVQRPASWSAIRWRAGQSAYLSFPTLSGHGFTSHPFTIATIDTSKTDPHSPKTLVFILRIRDGTTRRLAERVHPDARFPVLLNGPCSAPPILFGHEVAVLFAGGSGVAFTLPLLLDVISRAKASAPTCQRVLFVWAVRDIEHTQWIAHILAPALASAPSTLSLSIQFYITATGSAASSSSWDAEKYLEEPTPALSDEAAKEDTDADAPSSSTTHDAQNSSKTVLSSPFVRVAHGRPDIAQLLGAEIGAAAGSVSVSVCGTHALAESVRRALRTPRPLDILRGGPTVTLHVEAFGDA